MIGIAADLKERFRFGELWFLEKWEMYGGSPDGKPIPDVLTDGESKAIDLFKMLHDTVDAVPLSLIKATEDLRSAQPDLFETTLVHGIQVVGFGFSPTSAAQFVEELNRKVQRGMACA